MRGHACWLLVLLGSLFTAGEASALSTVEVSRTTMIRVDSGYTESASDPVGDGSWTSDIQHSGSGGSSHPVRAYQSSLVSDAELSGSGDVRMWTSGDYAESKYHVVFSVLSSTGYSFFVDNMDYDSHGYSGAPTGSVTLKQVDPANHATVLQTIYSVSLGRNTYPGDGSGYPDFSAQGTLLAGTYALDYRLLIFGSHNAAGPGLSGFDFVVTPEPGSGALLAFGLVGLASRRRR